MMSNSGEEEEPQTPHPKKLKLSTPSPSVLSSSPDDIILSCLARVSRINHPSLSLVSKRHRSLLFSHELYNLRSLMGFTENCIYLCLRIPPDPNPRWFTFSLNTINRSRRLIPVRSHFYQPREASSVVALGCGIYVIGGRIGRRRSSSVLFLDCRSHTWSTLPSMGVARYSAAAGVVGGKIYVWGGCEDHNSRRWGEVFDPKTQTWDALPMPPDKYDIRYPVIYDSAVIEEKVFSSNGMFRGLFYIPSEGIWKSGNKDNMGIGRGWHVIENVVYRCATGEILWCEAGELERCEPEVMDWREWRQVMGLDALTVGLSYSRLVDYGGGVRDHWEKLRNRPMGMRNKHIDDVLPGHKLSNCGPNMLLFWDVLYPECLEIWCAEISLERRKERGDIWGNIEWSEAVMTLDPPPHEQHCKLLYSLSLNL